MMPRETGSAPSEKGPTLKLGGDETTSSAAILPAAADQQIAARRRWAYSLIRRATSPAPKYGSAAWCALPDDDPAKIAAALVAAECWATDGDNLEQRLADEMALLRDGFKREEDREYQARYEAHRRTAPRFSTRPFAERRAEQMAAAAPREGDYPGRNGARS